MVSSYTGSGDMFRSKDDHREPVVGEVLVDRLHVVQLPNRDRLHRIRQTEKRFTEEVKKSTDHCKCLLRERLQIRSVTPH